MEILIIFMLLLCPLLGMAVAKRKFLGFILGLVLGPLGVLIAAVA